MSQPDTPEANDTPSKTQAKLAARRGFLKKIAWGTGGVFGIGGLVAVEEAYIGGIQFSVLPRIATGRLFSTRQTGLPPAYSPLDLKYAYNEVARWRAELPGLSYSLNSLPGWNQHSFLGITAPALFHRPQQAGLTLQDADGQEMYSGRDPYRIYEKFEDIPKVLFQALAYVEDRTPLEEFRLPGDNPAINYQRALRAVVENSARRLGLRRKASGGSTIPVQNAKNEAWARGQTKNSADKASQFFMASVRMFDSDRGSTTDNLRYEFLKYMNIVSLASHPKTGELRGWNDAMAIWFGNTTFNEILKGDLNHPEAALAFRQAFTLVMAVQKPDALLRYREGFEDGQRRVDAFLPGLVKEGIIPAEFADRVGKVELKFEDVGKHPALAVAPKPVKHVSTARLDLLKQLGFKQLYDLDRADVTATSTLYGNLNDEVASYLRQLNDPAFAESAGLVGARLLSPAAAPRVKWALMVQEIMDGNRALPRIKTDTYKGALDLNADGKLNMGSTQKLVMAWTYCTVMARLYDELKDRDAFQLLSTVAQERDHLTSWAVDYMQRTEPEQRSKIDFLEKALQRRYSAGPQCFFTGGGQNCPSNFERSENGGYYSVEQSVWQSVNLATYRYTQDVQEHVKWHVLGNDPRLFDPETDDPDMQALRRKRLEEFAQYEGGVYQSRAFVAMQNKSPEQILSLLATRSRGTPVALMATFMSVYPDAPVETVLDFALSRCVRGCERDPEKLAKLYTNIKGFDLNDRGYVAGVHPLWLQQAKLRTDNPVITLKESLAATRQDRLDIYKWLLKSKKTKTQNKAISIMLEQQAWKHIEELWRQGFDYPYRLVPSLATCIGVSGSNTRIMSNFIATLLNGGCKVHVTPFSQLDIAKGTPFETIAKIDKAAPGEQVMDPAVAAVVAKMARGNTEWEKGTGRRLKGKARLQDGTELPIGGKTGTNDEGETLGVRVAAWTGYIGPKLAMTMMAYVDDAKSTDKFTSGLIVRAVELMLKPDGPLQKLIDRTYGTTATPQLLASFDPVQRYKDRQSATASFALPPLPAAPTLPADPVLADPLLPEGDVNSDRPGYWDVPPPRGQDVTLPARPPSVIRIQTATVGPKPT